MGAQSTDMYSMGCLLWELFACRRAWSGLQPPQVIIKVGIQKARLPPLAGAPPAYQVRPAGLLKQRAWPGTRGVVQDACLTAMHALGSCGSEQPHAQPGMGGGVAGRVWIAMHTLGSCGGG